MRRKALIIAALFAGVLFFFIFRFDQFYRHIYTARLISPEEVTPIPKDKTVFNILLLGYGGGRHEGTYLTDSMMMIRIDLKKKSAAMISLPRDLWVKIPTNSGADFHAKINAAYQMGLFPRTYPDLKNDYKSKQGAGDLVKYVSSQILGIPVDYYVAVDFEGFTRAVDILGGVDVTVARGFDDPEYPIDGKETDPCGLEGDNLNDAVKQATKEPQLAFPCRYENLHFDAGLQHMIGATALKYVRSRHSEQDGGDFGRAARQQRFLEAIKVKVISIGFIPKIIPLLDELDTHIRTDIPFEIINKFIGESNNANDYQLTSLVISEKNYIIPSVSADRQYILIPKPGIDQWQEVHQWVENIINGITPTPTRTFSR